MAIVTPIDPLKPHVTIAIAYPCADWSKGVYVMGGGYGGETNQEIRAYFEQMSGVAPGMSECEGWRIVDLPYDHGDYTPKVEEPRPLARPEPWMREIDEILEGVLAEDHLPVG